MTVNKDWFDECLKLTTENVKLKLALETALGALKIHGDQYTVKVIEEFLPKEIK